MPASDIHELLNKYLTDAHSIEVQALAQLKFAPRIAGDDELARIYAEHEGETEEQKRLVAERAGDVETAAAARRIRDEELAMAQRIESRLDRTVAVALRELDPDDLPEQVTKYLAD